MENSVLESLRELGYDSPGVVLTAGIKDENFRQLVRKLTTEIHHLAETEEQPGNSNDTDMLAIELSSFLNELNCPYQFVTNGSVADRFHSAQGSLKLLDYLTAELMSLKMYHCNRVASKGTVIELQETLVASALKGICNAFGIAQPPPASLTTSDLFQKLNMRLDEVLKKYGRDRIGQPLLDIDVSKSWTGKQWADLEKRHGELDKEYDLRREMLLTRLDCTVQAFNWSERMAKKHGQILEAYKAKLQVLEKLVKGGANTDIVALLAARDLLLAIEKASSAAVLKNTKSKIQRHIMGNVPDRGGRAWEHAPPAPDMPSWQKKRVVCDNGGNRGRGGGGQHQNRGGRGGHSTTDNSNPAAHQQQSYDPNRGSGHRVQSGWSQRGGRGSRGFNRGRGRGNF